MDAFWMPFTGNRQFKSAPRMLARAEGMHYWKGLLIRTTGDIIALSPPLIIEAAQIDEIVAKLRRVLTTLD
jgi:adenosylmethionine-8-amino-7-oxononanoate aminotransferase